MQYKCICYFINPSLKSPDVDSINTVSDYNKVNLENFYNFNLEIQFFGEIVIIFLFNDQKISH